MNNPGESTAGCAPGTEAIIGSGRRFRPARDLVDTASMSNVGSPIITSLIQAAQAQQTASKTRDLKRAESKGRKPKVVAEGGEERPPRRQ